MREDSTGEGFELLGRLCFWAGGWRGAEVLLVGLRRSDGAEVFGIEWGNLVSTCCGWGMGGWVAVVIRGRSAVGRMGVGAVARWCLDFGFPGFERGAGWNRELWSPGTCKRMVGRNSGSAANSGGVRGECEYRARTEEWLVQGCFSGDY